MNFATLILICSISLNNECYNKAFGLASDGKQLIIVSKNDLIDLDVKWKKLEGEYNLWEDQNGKLYSTYAVGIDIQKVHSPSGEFIIFINEVVEIKGKYFSIRSWVVSTKRCEHETNRDSKEVFKPKRVTG